MLLVHDGTCILFVSELGDKSEEMVEVKSEPLIKLVEWIKVHVSEYILISSVYAGHLSLC